MEDNNGVDDNEEVLEVKNDVEGEAKGNTDNNQSGRKCGVWNIFEDNSLCIWYRGIIIPLLQFTQCIRYRGISYTIPLYLEFKINIFFNFLASLWSEVQIN